jgi:murein DD-endopeptidase MepM/ murein hydrolase activator NlpD
MGRLVASGLALAILTAAAIFAAADSWPWRRLETRLAGPATDPGAESEPNGWTASDTLRAGEMVADLFGRNGIGLVDLGRVLDLLGLDPRRIRAGQVFQFGHRDSAPGPDEVIVRVHADRETRVARADDGWLAEERAIRWERHPVRLEARIETSLYDALTGATWSEAIRADERVRLAWDLADVFAWAVDFSRDIQPADRLVVLFEREISERGESRLGRILASHLEVAGRRLSAYRFEGEAGESEFYDDEGTSLRRAFLRAPVEFRRIASGFSRSRKHPILGVWRRHQGIDYAAASGTPVLAAGDGTVVTAGWSGGYGRLVELRHANGISTRYAHLRATAAEIRPGVRVSQGDVIGYVGSSGLATAAHLHYEFRQNGVARNPDRVELGSGEPVPVPLRAAFQLERDRLRLLLAPPAPVTSGTVAGATTGDR